MNSASPIQGLLAPVRECLRRGGDAWEANLRYWRLRHSLRDEGYAFEPEAASLLGLIDVAMDAFSPDPDRGPDQIDEAQLRAELEPPLKRLQELGYLD